MDIKTLVKRQREYYNSGITKSYEYRYNALKRLEYVIRKHEQDIYEALDKDLNKSPYEAYITEISMVLEEISYAKKHLKSWMKPKLRMTSISQMPGKCFSISEPLGIALIISPWNYPFLLSIEPLIGAIAAGNCCILKPSEYSVNTSRLIKDLIRKVYPSKYIAVVEGGVKESESLLEERFDYIFYTGGINVGKIVMEKASKHLTPVTLELGGKSPCIVDKSANLKEAAKRIVFGKFLNAGQTCVAPDYLFVHESIQEEFLILLKKYIEKFYGNQPLKKREYGKIINEKHFLRLVDLMEGEEVFVGGQYKKEGLKIAPTILNHIIGDSKIMQEEIFGPILPVMTYSSLEEVEKFVSEREKPLALYLFTRDKSVEKRIIKKLSFGGGCVNDTIMHLATLYMGFGGVGYSGMGNYHGKRSFDTFSHEKNILKKSNAFDVPLRYMPYSEGKQKIAKRLL